MIYMYMLHLTLDIEILLLWPFLVIIILANQDYNDDNINWILQKNTNDNEPDYECYTLIWWWSYKLVTWFRTIMMRTVAIQLSLLHSNFQAFKKWWLCYDRVNWKKIVPQQQDIIAIQLVKYHWNGTLAVDLSSLLTACRWL